MILELLKVVFLFILIPNILGCLMCTAWGWQNKSYVYKSVIGYLFFFASFFLVFFIFEFFSVDIVKLSYLWLLLMLICMMGLCVYLFKKKDRNTVCPTRDSIFAGFKTACWDGSIAVWGFIAALALVSAIFSKIDSGSHMAVVSALKIQENEVAYSLFNSYPVFLAAVSYLCGVSAAAMVYTYLKAVYMLIAFTVYNVIGEIFFREKFQQNIFLAIIAVLCIWSGASANSIFYNLMLRIWDGDIFVFAVWLPLFIIWLMYGIKEKLQEWDITIIGMLFLCILLFSLNAFIIAFAIGVIYVVIWLVLRGWKNVRDN